MGSQRNGLGHIETGSQAPRGEDLSAVLLQTSEKDCGWDAPIGKLLCLAPFIFRDAVGFDSHPVSPPGSGHINVGNTAVYELSNPLRADPETRFFDDDRHRSSVSESSDRIHDAPKVSISFGLKELLTGIQMYDQAVHLEFFDKLKQSFVLFIPDLHTPDIRQNGDIRGEGFEMEVFEKLGMIEEDSNRTHTYGVPFFLGCLGQLAVGEEALLRPTGHTGDKYRCVYPQSQKINGQIDFVFANLG